MALHARKVIMRFLVLLLLLPNLSVAAQLEDVSILSTTSKRDSLKLKLQVKDASPDSHFFVDIVKSDPGAFEKLVLVAEKLAQKDSFKLNLDIKSFSQEPPGSYYRSQGISFSGTGKAGNSQKN